MSAPSNAEVMCEARPEITVAVPVYEDAMSTLPCCLSSNAEGIIVGVAMPEVMVAVPVYEDTMTVVPRPSSYVTQRDDTAQQQALPPQRRRHAREKPAEGPQTIAGAGVFTLILSFLMIGAMKANYISIKASSPTSFEDSSRSTSIISFSLDELECTRSGPKPRSGYCAGKALLGTSMCLGFIASFCLMAAGSVHTKMLGLIGSAIGTLSWIFLLITPIIVESAAKAEFDGDATIEKEPDPGYFINVICLGFLVCTLPVAIYHSLMYESSSQDAPPVVRTPVVAGAAV